MMAEITDPSLIAILEQPQTKINETEAAGIGAGDLDKVRIEALNKIKLARSLKERSKNGWFATGFGAETAAGLGGWTTAGSVQKDVSTLSAAGALQNIMELTEKLGKNPLTPISNTDFKALGDSIANLDIGQPDEQFQRNVTTIEDMYKRAYEGAGGKSLEEDLKALGDGPDQAPAAEEESSPAAATQPPEDQGPPALGLSFDEKGNVIYSDTAEGVAKADDTGIIGEKGGTHRVRNPAMAGANGTINAMLKDKSPNEEIVAYLRGKGLDEPKINRVMAQIRDVRTWQQRNPGYRGDFNVDVEHYEAPNTAWQNFVGSDVGAAAGAVTDAFTGFNLDSLAGALGKDPEEVRKAMAAVQAAHPKSATAGTIIGGVIAALGAEAAAAKSGLTGWLRTGAADMAYGSLAGAGATDKAPDGSDATAVDRLIGAGKGAAAATAGGFAGQTVASGFRGVRDPYVRQVNIQGIPTTLGQQYGGSRIGGIVKRTEDRIAGLPIIGDIINARRVEGITKFNERAFDRALEPIGIKAGGRVGEEAVDFAQEKISDAFDAALKGKTVAADVGFANDLSKAFGGAKGLPRIGDELADNIKTIMEPYMKGSTISGEAMQQMSRELRDLKAGYMTDPMKHRIGKAIDETEEAIFGMFRRQAPDVLPAYNRAKVAQRRLYTLADAVNAAKNKEGIFMPSQLGNADRKATVKTEGKVAAARGRGQFQDLQRAAQQVLPSQIPDSGTAGRIIIPGIALGVGGGSDAAGLTEGGGTTLAGILSLAYTRAGQRILTKPGRGGTGRVGRALSSDPARKALTAAGASAGVGLATQ